MVKQNDYVATNSEAGFNISWRSVFAGLVTFVAISILLSLVGSAIGFGSLDLTSNHPLSGVGTGLLVWLVISLIVSLGLSGYVAGITAQRAGFVHGFLTWALSVIATVFLLGNVVSGALGAVGQVMGTAGNATGNVIQSTGSAIANVSQDAFDKIAQELDVNVDTSNLDDEVIDALEKSDIPQLQPDYLKTQLNATVENVKDAGYAIVINGKNPKSVGKDLSAKIEKRVNEITKDLDRSDLEKTISENTELSEAEVSSAVDNAISSYETAREEALNTIDKAEKDIDELTQEAEQTFEKGRVQAEKITDETAKISLWTFAGLLIGLFITAFAGHLGSKTTDSKFLQ